MRFGNLELRKTSTYGDLSRDYLEIVKWETETCYTLSSWNKNGDLQFCGDRPFKLDKDEFDMFIMLSRSGQLLYDKGVFGDYE